MLAPFDHQRRATFFALLVCGLFHPLDVFHVLLGVLQVLLEFLVELGHGVLPFFFAFFDFVEFFFQTRRVLQIENVAEIFHQQIGDDQSDLGGCEFSSDLLYVLPLLNGGENRGVGRRAADAALFQFFLQRELLASLHRRQLVFQFLVFFVLAFLGFFVDF